MTVVPITRYNRATSGLIFPEYLPLGPIKRATLHHSAGPQAKTKKQAIELNKQYHRQHKLQWPSVGGISYHFCLDNFGRIYDLRPTSMLGAHVGDHNPGNVGIMVHGNYMKTTLNPLQRRTIKAMFRGQVKGLEYLGRVPWKGHREYPGHLTNECPGDEALKYLRWLRSTR